MKIFKEEKKCRVCKKNKLKLILDLGNQPLANNLQKKKNIKETIVPLAIGFCSACKLVQLTHTVNPNIMFKKYVWVTGTSDGAKLHSQNFYRMAQKRKISKLKKVLEVASNDGTFLKPFQKNNIFVVGVDPAKNISDIANKKNLKTLPIFFNYKNSKQIKKKFNKFDFIFARNVVPHTPTPLEIIRGMKNLFHSKSFGAIEFHYSKKILIENQYDSIYHEHFFYYSVYNIKKILEKFNLFSFDVQESPISGGSMIIYFSPSKQKKTNKLIKILKEEKKLKINSIHTWRNFAKKTKDHKKKLCKTISRYPKLIGYGASARSSTLLNYCNIDDSNIQKIMDQNNLKHNLFTPGSKIKIIKPTPNIIKKLKSLIILSWNFYDEIYKYLKKNGFKGVIIKPLPEVKVVKIK
jgi:hypothetical protein